MKILNEKTVTIRIPSELHRDIKIRIAKEQVSLKEYLVKLIKADLYGNLKKQKQPATLAKLRIASPSTGCPI